MLDKRKLKAICVARAVFERETQKKNLDRADMSTAPFVKSSTVKKYKFRIFLLEEKVMKSE